MEESFTKNTFEEESLENVRKQYIVTNTTLLGIHLLLTVPYFFLSRHMLAVNAFSILFYIVGYAFIRNNRRLITVYSFLILAEILLHDICCVLVFGWECGFQLWIISLVSTYIKDYITPDKSEREKKAYSALMLMIGFVCFCALYFVTRFVPLPFQDRPSETVEAVFLVMNAFITFTAMGAFTGIYTRQMELKYTQLHHQADYDQLTGLGNRYYMHDLLDAEEQHSNAVSGYSVAMIDIDHFKTVNDSYGHSSGDIVLCDIAEILANELPENYTAGRWGGEEFLVISDHSVPYDEFRQVMEELRLRIASRDHVLQDRRQIRCTVSVGTARYREGCSAQEVINRADENLYAAKTAGRNRLVAEETETVA